MKKKIEEIRSITDDTSFCFIIKLEGLWVIGGGISITSGSMKRWELLLPEEYTLPLLHSEKSEKECVTTVIGERET